jgi:lysocardiolipin and lysophospholipid acyltransferase
MKASRKLSSITTHHISHTCIHMLYSVGQYGQDLFSLSGTFFRGRPPKSVNMHWRRFRIADMPLHSDKLFADWVLARWREKDDLLQYFVEHQRFPADTGTGGNDGKEKTGAGWIETGVRPHNPFEWVQVFAPPAALGFLINVVVKMAGIVLRVMRIRS